MSNIDNYFIDESEVKSVIAGNSISNNAVNDQSAQEVSPHDHRSSVSLDYKRFRFNKYKNLNDFCTPSQLSNSVSSSIRISETLVSELKSSLFFMNQTYGTKSSLKNYLENIIIHHLSSHSKDIKDIEKR